MKVPPLLICFVVPVVILVGGVGLAAFFGYQQIPPLLEEVGRGDAKRGFVIELEKPGRYTVWSVMAASISGRSTSGEKVGLPPGGRLYVFNKEDGKELSLSNFLQQKKSNGGETSVSLGSFDSRFANQKVEVKATGLRSETTVSVTPENTGKAVQVFLLLLGIVLFSIALAIFTFILLLHRRQRALSVPN